MVAHDVAGSVGVEHDLLDWWDLQAASPTFQGLGFAEVLLKLLAASQGLVDFDSVEALLVLLVEAVLWQGRC